MDFYWQESNWQNNSFTARQAITFIVSTLLVGLFLLIPFSYHYKFSEPNALIAVELVKSKPVVPEKEIKPVVEPIAKPIRKTPETKAVLPTIIPKPIPKQVTKPIPKTITVTPKPDKPKLPSAGIILNSLKNRTTLQNVSKDFQIANDNDDTFIYKETLKQKTPLLVTDQPVIREIVNPKDPLALRATKGLLNYLFIPMKDQVKTKDSLNYCGTLGRRSTFCPNANPLID